MAPRQFVNESLIEPGLVDAQVRVCQQTVAIEALDVVPLIGAAITPDMDVILFHRADQHRARYGTAKRRGIEVRYTGRGDVERATLQCGKTLAHQWKPTIDETRLLGAVLHSTLGDRFVVIFIRLPQVRGICARDGTLLAHPKDRRAGVQTTRKGDSHPLAYRE